MREPPTPEQIRAARNALGITQEQAAALVHRKGKMGWYSWESGRRVMCPAIWELFLIKSLAYRKDPGGLKQALQSYTVLADCHREQALSFTSPSLRSWNMEWAKEYDQKVGELTGDVRLTSE